MASSSTPSPNSIYSRAAILVLLAFFAVHGLVFAEETTEPVKLSPIIVTPGKFTILGETASVVSLTKRDIESLPLIDNDIARAAHIIPGVVSNEFSARFNLRGGEKDEILVRLDGMELYDPYHLQDYGGAVSIIDLGLVRRADLLMGGFPAEYGDKLSGVFDINVKEGNREEFTANLGIDLINAHALLEGPLSQSGSWLLSARRGYVDVILALMGADEELKPQYADLYGKITYDLTAQDTLTLNGLYAWDKNRINEEDDENDLNSRYQNALVWTKWRHHFNRDVWSDLFLFNGLATRDRQEGVNGIDTRDFGFLGAKTEINAQFLSVHTLRAGLEWRWSVADYNYSVPTYGQTTAQFIRSRCSLCNLKRKTWAKVDAHGSSVKGFLQEQWQLHPKLGVNIGTRYLFQNYRQANVQKHELSPRIALAYRPIENLVLRTAWGFYHQPTDLITIPVEDGVDDIGRAEQAIHYIIGGDYVLPNKFLLRAEAYYKNLSNLIGHIPDYGRQTRIIAPAHSGSAKGIDLFVNGVISDRLTGSLGYAFSVAKAREDSTSVFPSVFGTEYFREFDQRHTVALNGNYRLSREWQLHFAWRFHTGNPTTNLTHSVVKLLEGQSVCERNFGDYNTERLPAFHSLDFRLTKTSPHNSWQLSWYLQVLNLYNRSNVHEYVFIEERDDLTNVLLDCDVSEEPFFPILPTVGVSVRF